MTQAISDNVAGHRTKYEHLKKHLGAEKVGQRYVGGGEPAIIGFIELEFIRRFREVDNLDIIDIGCGIGRLARVLAHEPIKSYLGLDIIEEILKEGIDSVHGDSRFAFDIIKDCKIQRPSNSADLVVGFSLITHLMDEETFEYFVESRRVLRLGGTAIFSFFDILYPPHQEKFVTYSQNHRSGHGDILKFTAKPVLEFFAHKAGFSKVEFIDSQDRVPASGRVNKLTETLDLPSHIEMAQSGCILTA